MTPFTSLFELVLRFNYELTALILSYSMSVDMVNQCSEVWQTLAYFNMQIFVVFVCGVS